jgi:YesN/AraC family two-component response regulator
MSLHPIVDEDTQEGQGKKKRTLLLVDDNNEIRRWLANELSADFRVIEAENGKTAYHLALSEQPDILVSDVIMPVMDGFELCEKIRKNPNISSLPIILLTARGLDQDRIEGMEAGADAYMTKPFNMNVLRTTAENLIKGRQRLKVTLAEPKVDESDIREVDIKTPDDRLLDRIVRIINEHLGDPDLTVEQVAAEAGISRVHLHRKLKELTGQTSRDFIRNLRLRKAAEMLSEKKHAISELADAVGFQSASSFATAFKDLFGVSPSEYGQQHKGL